MNNEMTQQALLELRKSKEFIRDNWSDSLAQQYIIWIEQIENDLKSLEQKRETSLSKLCEIQKICNQIADNSEGEDEPKTLRLTRHL